MNENRQIPVMKMSPKQLKVFNQFNDTYELEKSLQGDKKITLKDSQVKCRFCGTSDEKSFKKEAHVIPQLMGRAKPTSKFECDKCNSMFSRYETDLGDYLLIDRAILGQPKKTSGNPKYKNNEFVIQKITAVPKSMQGMDEAIKLQELLDAGDNVTLLSSKDNNTPNLKRSDNEFEAILGMKSYIPLNIFRVFAKIGLSLLDENELSDYSKLKELLLYSNFQIKPEYDRKFDMFHMYIINIPLFVNLFPVPVVRVYKRKIESTHIKRTIVFFFGSKIFQIQLFSDTDIKEFYSGKEKRVVPISPFINPYFPHYLSEELNDVYAAIGKATTTWTNLFSTAPQKDDTYTFKLTKNDEE